MGKKNLKELQQLFQGESVAEKRSSPSSRQQLIRKKELAAFAEFQQNIRNNPDHKNSTFVGTPKGLPKMSEVLIEFIDPVIEDSETYDERLTLLKIAVMAWNMSLLPENARQEMIEEFVTDLQDPLDPDEIFVTAMQNIFEMLIERKLALYANDERIIEDFKLTEHEAGFHISASYTL